jgi:hypothetical protein
MDSIGHGKEIAGERILIDITAKNGEQSQASDEAGRWWNHGVYVWPKVLLLPRSRRHDGATR